MITKRTAYKYEMPYTDPFLITQCLTNGSVVQHKVGIMYVGLSHKKLILKLKILVQKICVTMSAYDHQLYTFVLTIKVLETWYIIGIAQIN